MNSWSQDKQPKGGSIEVSQETSAWLNNQTLIGFTDKRGFAWHYRIEDQGAESNHYPGAVPLEDVLRRLFNFTVDETPLYIRANGGFVELPGRKAMVTSDDNSVLGVFKAGYQGHQYQEWLLENVATILDDELGIGSAGLLKNRGQAWVSVEVPDTIRTPEGVEFRPNLLACTSFDGSLATTYKRVVTAVVCDNTLSAGLSEDGLKFKLKHTKYSGLRITDAREALGIVYEMVGDFEREVAELTSWKVSDEDFMRHLDEMVPLPEDVNAKRGITMSESKRAEIINLYKNDERAAPWNGTAFGVLQAYNTWNHHKASVRKGVPRVVRNMENVVSGKYGNLDAEVLTTLRDLVPA
jgi:phage/plasmid-like protein (TIGR03299 family)